MLGKKYMVRKMAMKRNLALIKLARKKAKTKPSGTEIAENMTVTFRLCAKIGSDSILSKCASPINRGAAKKFHLCTVK